MPRLHFPLLLLLLAFGPALPQPAAANDKVHVSRFWHNHQPIYWPEWNNNGAETSRVEYAWDSIVLKFNRSYAGSSASHPENNLEEIFGKDDRRNAYQSGPRNSLGSIFDQRGGFALSYSGSLIDNVRQLGGGGHLGYGGDWNGGNREARGWTTPAGAPRLDLVGFTYHHSLAPLLPKEVLRKEIRIFKQAWWKAWGGNSDLSDHSKGFFPTEMAYSRHIVDVLVDEGYEWVIVPSHHISRTCPTYFDQFDLENGDYGIFSSPPNRADLLGPSPTTGWWYGQPNPGNAAWNVAPYAYQLHRVKYVDPETGAEKQMIAVPSDDVLSYRYGYADEGIGKIGEFIAPFADDPARPVLVMPATDGDNAWGGGSSSWFEATPRFFNDSASAGYRPTTPQDFVDAHGAAAPLAHIEDGAWIFPESDYGSPYFLKWIEPPVGAPDSPTLVPGTVIDMETPGFALKFWSWAPVVTGANWVETAEQILRDEGGTVEDWKIQSPYDWDGSWTAPNDVERAWHIYLAGLDSGFNYYGGLGNDDEVKPALATTRAIQLLQPWMTDERRAQDRTPPSVLKPQRFPYNPGGYTFGWFNSIPGGNTSYLKKMPSEFYIWTHAYDLSGLDSLTLKVRIDGDGVNPLADNQNETFAGGPDVGDWRDLPMTRRSLPRSQSELNAAANNGQINYFIEPPELADYYFVRISENNVGGFRGKLLDYYIEAVDGRGNVHKSEIQHVFVEDDGAVTEPPAAPATPSAGAVDSGRISLSWAPVANAGGYRLFRDGIQIADTSALDYDDSGLSPETTYRYTLLAYNGAGASALSPPVEVNTPAAPDAPPAPGGLSATALSATAIALAWNEVPEATGYLVFRDGVQIAATESPDYTDGGLAPATRYGYTVLAQNAGGNSAPSAPAEASTLVAPPSFTLGADEEPSGYLLAQPGMKLLAAVRGSLLYLATWTPSGGANDHFVFLGDRLESSALTPAPWDKAGRTALPEGAPFLAGESDNSYLSWFHAGPSASTWRSPTGGGRMEGVIDLVETFGELPDRLYLSAAAYETGNSGLLAAQAPAGNGDGNLDPDEFMAFPLASLQDRLADGTFDRLDPDRAFRVRLATATGTPVLTWPAIPGRSYEVWRCTDLVGDRWTRITDSPLTAASGQDQLSIEDSAAANEASLFYRIEALDP